MIIFAFKTSQNLGKTQQWVQAKGTSFSIEAKTINPEIIHMSSSPTLKWGRFLVKVHGLNTGVATDSIMFLSTQLKCGRPEIRTPCINTIRSFHS